MDEINKPDEEAIQKIRGYEYPDFNINARSQYGYENYKEPVQF